VVAVAKKKPKKKLEPVTGPLAVMDKPVDFGGVSIGKTTGRIGISVDRSYLGLDDAADMFCGRRLTGKVVLGRAGDAANQTTLVDDLDAEVGGAFDCKGFRVTEGSIAAGLTFALAEVDIAELAKFSKGFELGEIPADAPDEDFEDERPILKAEGEWTEVKLDTLPFKPRVLKALIKAELTTMGKLADFTALKGEWWWRDIPGIGATAAEEIEEITAKFWAANPQP
jgi:hypothetical protein